MFPGRFFQNVAQRIPTSPRQQPQAPATPPRGMFFRAPIQQRVPLQPRAPMNYQPPAAPVATQPRGRQAVMDAMSRMQVR